MVKYYQKKSLVVEAVQYTGDNLDEIKSFCNENICIITSRLGDAVIYSLYINTLEGNMHISTNDYIIKGVDGEYYPCKSDIFEMTYEEKW